MSALFAECKLVLVIAGVLTTTLAAAWWMQVQNVPLYLPAEDPALFARVYAAASRDYTDEAVKTMVNVSTAQAGIQP